MRHGSLFSGIGGFDLASRWMGWQNVFTCEIEEFPRQVLKHHFPEAIHYEDIKRTDFSVHHGQIDILTGGFPCQPFSIAGKRLGKHDERHLWPEMFRAIREIRPRWVVGENVRGLLSWSDGLVLEEVYADLESEGYEVQAFLLPAAGINAPHKRDRVWIVATNAQSNGNRGGLSELETTDDLKWQSKEYRKDNLQSWNNGKELHASDSSSIRCGRWDQRSETDQRAQWQMDQDERQHGNGIRGETTRRGAIYPDSDLQRLEHKTWNDFPAQSPVCRGDDGLPAGMDGITFSRWRRESIKAYGNAIVPQIAYRIFETIKQTESSTWI